MLSVVIYAIAISSANLSAAHFGPIATPFNALFLIGLDMAIRNIKHEQWFGNNLPLKMTGLIISSGVVSYAINPASGVIAIASLVAFSTSVMVDSFIYQSLIKRKFAVKANISNCFGALVDSLVFPLIAFGSFMPWVVASQFAAKVIGGLAWSLVIARCRNTYSAQVSHGL